MSTVADDPGRAVDVGQEHLEGAHPLGHAVGDRSHSAPVKIRGTTSRGNGRSSPSRSKVTPWSMKARASREARAETSSGPIWASEEATPA